MTAKFPTIFYDLETSDLSPVGQIMNFCFILVDDDFEIQDEFSGTVRLSRLQLPRAAAIAANKINVIEHQQTAQYSEAEAMCAIHKFIKNAVSEYGDYKISLIGYNSARFDLDYLRTSLIRNGLHPYFRVQPRDLLFVSRKLSVSRDDFPRRSNPDSPEKLSLKLETLCQAFGLLEGSQAHESKDDVLLSISLAKHYLKYFKIDVRRYIPYEPVAIERPSRGLILERESPSYDLSGDPRFESSPYLLLDMNYRYSLWVNLNRYRELAGVGEPLERSIEFFKIDGSDFFSNLKSPKNAEVLKIAETALEKLKNISLQNYFKDSDCDIEAQIYRLDQNAIEALNRHIWHADKSEALSDDARKLLTRFKLANAADGTALLDEKLKDYALYRYGGRMKISRYSSAVYEEGVEQEGFHPSLKQLLKELEEVAGSASPETQKLMSALAEYYYSSAVYQAAESLLDKK